MQAHLYRAFAPERLTRELLRVGLHLSLLNQLYRRDPARDKELWLSGEHNCDFTDSIVSDDFELTDGSAVAGALVRIDRIWSPEGGGSFPTGALTFMIPIEPHPVRGGEILRQPGLPHPI